MRTTTLHVRTGSEPVVVDITEQVADFVSGAGDGLVSLFALHATAGLGLMETGASSEADLIDLLGELFPRDDRYRHRHGPTGHGGDHLLPVFVSPSLMIPVEDGRLVLGTWQSVVLVDPNVSNTDRQVRLSFLEA